MPDRVTEDDLARWEALADEVMHLSPPSTEFAVTALDLADKVSALVNEVKRLRALEWAVRRMRERTGNRDPAHWAEVDRLLEEG